MHSGTILLVEDNGDDELLTLDALRSGGIANTVQVVRDGAEALDYLFGRGSFASRDTTRQPCLTLLDLNLPKVRGLEVLRLIKADEKTRHIPVVVLTSSSESADIRKCYDQGASSHVLKPLDLAHLRQAVSQFAGQRSRRRLRVLMVEDSEDDALLIADALRRGGFDSSFTRVDSAVELRAALPKEAWHLVLSDNRLPGFSALEAFQICRELGHGAPFLIVSGAADDAAAAAATEAGVRDWLVKDDLKRLISAVERECEPE